MSDQIGHSAITYHYRLYDAAGVLLYAGVTTSMKRRLAEHRRKYWYSEVARVETDEYPARWRAMLAEFLGGHGRYGILPGGIGKGLAASMTDEELTEAAAHPTYARWSDGTLARQWGLPVMRIRSLRTASVTNHTSKES
jgi:hypothetical protein